MFTDAQDAPTTCVGADRRPIPVGEPDEITEDVGARPAGGPLQRVPTPPPAQPFPFKLHVVRHHELAERQEALQRSGRTVEPGQLPVKVAVTHIEIISETYVRFSVSHTLASTLDATGAQDATTPLIATARRRSRA